MDKKIIINQVIAFFGILGSVFFVYGNIHNHQFLSWDDYGYIINNIHIKVLSLDNILWAFMAIEMSNWHPLTWLVYITNYYFFGENAVAFIYVNIVIHILNSFLVYKLFILLSTIRETNTNSFPFLLPLSGIAAALAFAIHPQHVESVVWIAETKDVLCAFFYLSAIIYYLSQEIKKKTNYFTLTVIFFCALMSKPMAVTLPVVLIIFDIAILDKINIFKASWKEYFYLFSNKWALFSLSIIISVITLWGHADTNNAINVDMYNRLINAIFSIFHYIKVIIYPVDISPFYPFIYRDNIDEIVILLACGITLISLLSVLSLASLRFRYVGAIWLSYLVILLPVIGVIAKVGYHSYADRYAYLPTVGFYLLFGGIIFFILQRIKKKYYLFVLIYSMLIFFSWGNITHEYIKVWKDNKTLWTFVLSKYPNVDIAYKLLADDYLDKQQYDMAIYYYNKALELAPNSTLVLYSLAKSYKKSGNIDKQIYYYQLASERNPNSITAVLKVAQLCTTYKKKKCEKFYYTEAIGKITRLYDQNKNNIKILELLVNLNIKLSNYERANYYLDKLVSIYPDHPYLKLNNTYIKTK